MSKWVMYDFVYNYLKPKWGFPLGFEQSEKGDKVSETYETESRIEIIQTDTDGLMLMVKTEDFYEDIKKDIGERFDTSNFKKKNIFGITPKNKMKLGCFKIETGEYIVLEIVGLRSKMYSYPICKAYKENRIKLKKSEKGVPYHISKKHDFELWKQILNNEKDSIESFNMIKSDKLDIYTINQTKIALSNFDDKRYILDDGYSTLAHGHYLISQS
jgi:hypothetical protein